MNKAQAEDIVNKTILSELKDCALLEKATQEFEKCFAVYYQSKTYIESGNFTDMLVGHGPVLVEKTSGRLHETGSAYSTEHYVQAFESCGDPFGEPTSSICITHWCENGDKIQTIKCLNRYSGKGLAAVKADIETVANRNELSIKLSDPETAAKAAHELSALGLKTKQLWSNQC